MRKIRLISKFMTSQPSKQTTAIHILPNTLRSNRIGQLIEYNKRNIFLKNLYARYGRESIPRHSAKKSKLSILGQQPKFLSSFFLLYAEFTLTSCKTLKRNKRRSETSLPASFSTFLLNCLFRLRRQLIF